MNDLKWAQIQWDEGNLQKSYRELNIANLTQGLILVVPMDLTFRYCIALCHALVLK